MQKCRMGGRECYSDPYCLDKNPTLWRFDSGLTGKEDELMDMVVHEMKNNSELKKRVLSIKGQMSKESYEAFVDGVASKFRAALEVY